MQHSNLLILACLLSKALVDSFCLPKQLLEANELKLHSYRIIWLITDCNIIKKVLQSPFKSEMQK